MTYDPTILMGVELEVEILDNPQRNLTFESKHMIYGSYPKHHAMGNIHNRHGNIVKIVDEICEDKITTHHDNTINDGFEWIGSPMNLEENKKIWNRLLTHSGIAPYIHGEDVKETPGNGYGTHDVGMHVHVSGDPITPLTLGKLLMFINSKINRGFIEYLAGRPLNRFCETQPKMTPQSVIGLYHTAKCTKRSKRNSKITYSLGGKWDAYKADGTPCCAGSMKLQKFAFARGAMWVAPAQNTGDYEIRIFKSTVKPERFNANLEFCVSLVEFVHQATIKELHFKEFCVWMSEKTQRIQYPNLFKFLRKEGYTQGIVPSSPARLWRMRSAV